MKTARSSNIVDESTISECILNNDGNTIEYLKKGYGILKTDRPISSVRLELAIHELGMNQSDLAQKAKVTQPTISRIIDGKTKQSSVTPKIARVLNLNSEWLAGVKQDNEFSKLEKNILKINSESFVLVDMYNFQDKYKSNPEKYPLRASKTMIATSLVQKRSSKDHLKFIIAEDESNHPEIRKGATIVFDMSNLDINNGDFYAVNIDGIGECVRTLFKEPNENIRIRSKHADYPEYILNTSEDNFKILGKVCFVMNGF